MDIKELQRFFQEALMLHQELLQRNDQDLIWMAKTEDLMGIKALNRRRGNLEAVIGFIKAIYENFPELKTN